MASMGPATRLVEAAARGEPQATAELLPLMYDELRLLAARQLAQEQPGQTLQPTALVHEAYLRLIGPGEPLATWKHRGHFLAAAAEAMRRILIEAARRKLSVKHGGGRNRTLLEDVEQPINDHDNLLVIDEALTRFAEEAPDKAQLVKLRFFAGLTTAEAAQALDISVATAERWWTFARTWLYAALKDGEENRTKMRD
jgi:RNA polymerase sigma factor (TIGR02999 family)